MAGGGEGLLARSYQPGSDAFLLTNPTDQAVHVEIESTAPWVQPRLRAAVIPPGQTRQVDLTIEPPTSPGVHSAYIIISDPRQEIPSMRIPVTYVRPLLKSSGSTYLHRDALAAARYRRYFIEVAPGTADLSVATRVMMGPGGRPQGAVQMQVFRPDGHLIYRSEEIGYQGQGLTTLFQTRDPVEGVWEVVGVACRGRAWPMRRPSTACRCSRTGGCPGAAAVRPAAGRAGGGDRDREGTRAWPSTERPRPSGSASRT